MKKTLLMTAAIAALMASAPAFAGDTDLNNIQINLFTDQNASVGLLHIDEISGKLDISTAAIGNSFSVDSVDGKKDLELHSLQVNAFTVDNASVRVRDVEVDGDLTVNTQAAGNNFQLTGLSTLADGNGVFQANVAAIQDASVSIRASDLNQNVTIGTVALGNNISLTAEGLGHSVTTGQLNAGAIQDASVNLTRVSVSGDLGISTAAVGNNISIKLVK